MNLGFHGDILAAGLQITGRRSVIHRGPDTTVHDEQIELSDLPYGHYGVPQNRTEAVLQDHLVSIVADVPTLGVTRR